jgi:hypothetical protein
MAGPNGPKGPDSKPPKKDDGPRGPEPLASRMPIV